MYWFVASFGKYSAEVALAYGVGLFLLAIAIVQSVWQARRMKSRLRDAEGSRTDRG